MNELVLIRGLPGSGKSTLARSMRSHIHLETDRYFMNSARQYIFDPTKIRAAHSWCQRRAHACLSRGLSVVVSNTFTQRWEMQPYLDMAEHLGVPVRIIHATGNFGNVHGVPQEAIDRMAARWEDVTL